MKVVLRRRIGVVLALAAFARGVVGDRADACVCVNEAVVVNDPSGRVFTLDPRIGPDALAGATVQLRRRDDGGVVAQAKTDESGSFRVPTDAVGRYVLEVSMPGFKTTAFDLEIKKRRSGSPGGVAVRLDVGVPECTCGDACASAPAERGLLSPRCLQRRAHESVRSR